MVQSPEFIQCSAVIHVLSCVCARACSFTPHMASCNCHHNQTLSCPTRLLCALQPPPSPPALTPGNHCLPFSSIITSFHERYISGNMYVRIVMSFMFKTQHNFLEVHGSYVQGVSIVQPFLLLTVAHSMDVPQFVLFFF